MFIHATVSGEIISINMDKVFDFHPDFQGRAVLHFDSTVALCGQKHDHKRMTIDQSYLEVVRLLAEAGGRG